MSTWFLGETGPQLTDWSESGPQLTDWGQWGVYGYPLPVPSCSHEPQYDYWRCGYCNQLNLPLEGGLVRCRACGAPPPPPFDNGRDDEIGVGRCTATYYRPWWKKLLGLE